MIKGQKKPYKLHIYFHRKTKARFDGINLAQGLFDEMTNIGYWEDDNMDIVLPQFEGWEVDKENPRTLLWLQLTFPLISHFINDILRNK